MDKIKRKMKAGTLLRAPTIKESKFVLDKIDEGLA